MAAFKLNLADLEFVLRQIKVSEANSTAHAGAGALELTAIHVDATGNVVSQGTPGAVLAIPDPHVPVGLRTVDGRYNNIVSGRENWGAADNPMPRLLDGSTNNDQDGDIYDPPGPAIITNTNYGANGSVADADPRIISNLVVDMSFNNPSAIVAALTFVGEGSIYGPGGALESIQQAFSTLTSVLNSGADQAVKDAAQATFDALIAGYGVEAEGPSIVIPNVAPDEGLSAPFNAWMTFFGQFFDHGLDMIAKGGNGTVYIPLQPDDPLYVEGGQANFMVLTRSTPAGDSQLNLTTPFVDQNQTYTSHASHQVFLREYEEGPDGPVATGRLLEGAEGGLATWADVKDQAREILGIDLTDRDVLNIPLLRTDAYGEFIRGTNGYPQVVINLGVDGIPNTADDIVIEGNPNSPINTFTLTNGTFTGAIRTGHAFLDDIAHNAVPGFVDHDRNPGTPAIEILPDADTDTGNPINPNAVGVNLTYDNELLDRHYVTGDGRGNENIALTTVHHIFHSEHNRQVISQKLTLLTDGDLAFVNQWLADPLTAPQLAAIKTALGAATNQAALLEMLEDSNATTGVAGVELNWDGERLFQAARFATEMQYQHLVFEEFARKVQPNIDPFVFNSVTDIDPSIFSEFANVVYRFGHSMLTDAMPRIGTDGELIDDIGLIAAFLNPVAFDSDGDLSHDEAAAAIVRGMTIERGNEIDEFIVGSLRNSLLGLPLDLAAINIARGRDTEMPTLNHAREQLFAATGSTFLKPYDNWVDFAANLKNPASVINFIAAFGTHDTIDAETTLIGKRAAAQAIVMNTAVTVTIDGVERSFLPPADRVEFLTGTTTNWDTEETGINLIDLWIGGLAEKKMPFGGFLGSTFNAVFEAQLEALQDGDRFYYLTRTQGQNFLNALEQNSFAKMMMANTNLAQPGADGIRGTADDVTSRHIGVDSFAAYDFVLEINPANQADYDPQNSSASGVDPTGNDPILEAMGLGKVQRDNPLTPELDTNYIRFTGGEHIVMGGTNDDDVIISDFGDDGIWGDAGDDRIESGAGVDLVNGGSGNDIITDSGDSGDFLKGDEGDDVIANSNGLDILMGGSGKDAVFVGVDDTEVFGGSGDDFILGGAGVDFLLGNEGSDWIEGAGGFDTIAGDNSELFFNSALIGHDVMFAGDEEMDFDAESGDDIMVQGESVMRNEGMFGFDWAIFKGMALDGYADMRIPIFTTEQEDVLRNRFDKVEALSGWKNNDILMGDDRVFGEIAPGDTVATTENIFFNDGLDQAGIDRIAGLSQIVSVGATGRFESGNILLGGAGSDQLRGNGGDDIIDGDRWLNVRIRLTAAGAADTAANEIASIASMNHVFTALDFASAAAIQTDWIGKSLSQLMIARIIEPSQLHIVREVVTGGVQDSDRDVAIFNDVFANYTITGNPDGSITVTHVTVSDIVDPLTERPLLSDGADTVRNVEVLRFSDQDIELSPPELYLLGDVVNYEDNFGAASHGNSNGDDPWDPDWVESGDLTIGNVVTGGQIQLDAGGGGGSNVLRFIGGAGNDGATITRAVDLSGAASATLTYSANPDSMEAGESVQVQFAADGSNFVTLRTITGDGGNQTFNETLTGPFSATAAVRFVATAMNNTNDVVSIDNLEINFTRAGAADYETTFIENGADQDIASNPIIVENDEIVLARIVLTNAQAGDSFDIPDNLPGNIDSAVDNTVAGRITVNLTGTGTIAQWQSALQAIEFTNNSQNPSTVDRIIQVTVNDGLLNSNVATTTVNVQAVDDEVNAANDTIFTNLGGASIVVPEWTLLFNDTDPDSPITITSVGGANNIANLLNSADTISFSDPLTGTAGGSFTYVATGAPGDTDNATVNVTNQGRTFVLDQFGNAGFGNTNGDANWGPDWDETGDNDVAATGQIRIDPGGDDNNVMVFFGGAGAAFDGAEIQRTVNLAGSTAAALSYSINEIGLDAGDDFVRVLFSRDGTTFVEVDLINSATGSATRNIDLTLFGSGPFTANAAIRFVASSLEAGDRVQIDNVRVDYDIAANVTGNNESNVLLGNDAGSTLDGSGGNDIIIGGRGNDLVIGGAGNDNLVWNANASGFTDGRDKLEGDAGTDTLTIFGNASGEIYRVYSRASALNAGLTIDGDTEIVITRNGTNNASIIAELDNIEEIVVNLGGGTDQVIPIGNFNPTTLSTSTITVNGGAGNDTVDVSSLQSAHRILFRSNGGNDTIVGDLRPQDVIELAPGQNPASYTLVDNGNGTKTYTNGTHSITFTGVVPQQFQTDTTPDEDAIDGAFEYTPSDIEGLEALVRGQTPPSAGDDDVPVGFRDLSGLGNNEDNPSWGAADQAFIRLTEARFGEGMNAEGNNRAINPIFSGLDPRTISNILGDQEAGLPDAGNEANIFFMAFGQYVDHGLDFLPKGGNGSVPIGGVGGGMPGSNNPADLTRGTVMGWDGDIPLHKNQTSPFVDQNQAYGSHSLVGQFLREGDDNGGLGAHLLAGVADPSNPDFKLLPTLRELIVHHWENNTVFTHSSLPGGSASFRDYYPGLVTGNSVSGYVVDTAAFSASNIASNFMGSTHPLLLDANPFVSLLDHYVAGDGRANENFALTSIHTIWARNHNYHVEALEAAGFEGTAEQLFQAAKMVNEAEYQRVVFDEYVETLLGGLRSEGTHGFDEYDPDTDPAISHEFAAAAFRFGHSLVSETLTVLDANGNPVSVSLVDAFLNPSSAAVLGPLPPGYVPQPGYAQHGVNAIIGGTVTQPSEDVDFNIVDAVRDNLVRISADLFAFNVARGWDLGLGTLNQIRMALAASDSPYVQEAVGFAGGNLTPYTSWEDFQQRNGLSNAVIAQFRQAYPDLVLTGASIAAFQAANPDIVLLDGQNGAKIVKGIDRVDFWVGGLAERHINDGIVGQTFWVVLHEQFERLQDADRLYYIERFDSFDLYENFIDGQEFADIVARNTGMTNLPEHMFRTEEIDDEEDQDDYDVDNDDDEEEDDDETEDDDEEEDTTGEDDEEDEDGEEEDDEDTDAPVPPSSPGVGTPAADVLIGTSASDNLVAFGGDDVILGHEGADAIVAGAGDDFVNAGGGKDVISANAGDDHVFAGGDDDMIYGDDGADRIFAEGGNDIAEGDAGDDTVVGGLGNDIIVATLGDGSDTYFGDELNGGSGTDTLDMSKVTANATVDIGTGVLGHGSAFSSQTGTDTLWGIENVTTGSGDDHITASDAVNVIDGGDGDDVFHFLTTTAAMNDTILNFQPGDKIDLSGIDANTGAAGKQSFTLTAGSITQAAQLMVSYQQENGEDYTVIQGNTGGDTTAEFKLKLKGSHVLDDGNFQL